MGLDELDAHHHEPVERPRQRLGKLQPPDAEGAAVAVRHKGVADDVDPRGRGGAGVGELERDEVGHDRVLGELQLLPLRRLHAIGPRQVDGQRHGADEGHEHDPDDREHLAAHSPAVPGTAHHPTSVLIEAR